ncbi:hypothetical protein BKA64DRAFT_128725 [Cadophora sp. MPI-SDFR-AT-0126]|nr:hypothetical protein BKA64DRAFT_128725 [Leotiomycetes sp. MPI-SDFR-AT-0126]
MSNNAAFSHTTFFAEPRRLYIDRRTGHYIRVTSSGIMRHTHLFDTLESCASMTRDDLKPLIEYFKGILETKRKYYHPEQICSSQETSLFETRSEPEEPEMIEGVIVESTMGSAVTSIPASIVDTDMGGMITRSFVGLTPALIPNMNLGIGSILGTIASVTPALIGGMTMPSITGSIPTSIPSSLPEDFPSPTPLDAGIENLSLNQVLPFQPPQSIFCPVSNTQAPRVQESASAPPITEFKSFKFLPVEIQIQIWIAALPGPRIFETSSTGLSFLNRPQDILTAHKPLLSLLHTCRLAHALVYSHYTRISLIMLGWTFPVQLCSDPCYLVDFEKDVFYFPNADVRVLTRLEGTVRHLALSVTEVGWFRGFGFGPVGSVKVVLWGEEEVISEDDGEAQTRMVPAPEFKALKSVTFVGDCERVLMDMEEKFGVGAETDFEHAVWEWAGNSPNQSLKPIQRTRREDEEDNPYWTLHRDEVNNVERVLDDEIVRDAYAEAGVKVRFELWRRPRQKGRWVKRLENIGGQLS